MQRAAGSGERVFLATTWPPKAMSSSGLWHAAPVGRLRAPTCVGSSTEHRHPRHRVHGRAGISGQSAGVAVPRPASGRSRLRLGCGHLGHRGRVPLPLSAAPLRWRSGGSSCGSRRDKCLDESGRDDSRIADARLAARVDIREPGQRGRVRTGASRPAERPFTRLRQRRRRRPG